MNRPDDEVESDRTVDYRHDSTIHTVRGARPIIADLLAIHSPRSIVDVGCGTGAWLRAALDLGVSDVAGIDGIVVPDSELAIPRDRISRADFTGAWTVERKFDLALCLEVAEHLEQEHGLRLVDQVARLADVIAFSAAIPGQGGQHHVNCQWPAYWQSQFNCNGFVCDDSIRWRHWNDGRIEPWYRQNLFLARRDEAGAGREARIRPVVHPDMLRILEPFSKPDLERALQTGSMPMIWYLRAGVSAFAAKLARRLSKARRLS